MKHTLKSSESSLSSAKIVKRPSKLKLSKHCSYKLRKKKHFNYLNAPHNTSSFLINEFNKNNFISNDDNDIPQGSMKDLMNYSADFFKASFSSFDDITFLCLWYAYCTLLNFRWKSSKCEENSNIQRILSDEGRKKDIKLCDKKKGK